mgnify:CR=1 FL=1
MIVPEEQALIKNFVIKGKQDRYLTFIANDKTRKKFKHELYHFNDFNWKLFREISGSEIGRETITREVKIRKHISTCHLISANSEYDGKAMSVSEAIENAVGIEGTILIFGIAEVVYYGGEAPNRRYISI